MVCSPFSRNSNVISGLIFLCGMIVSGAILAQEEMNSDPSEDAPAFKRVKIGMGYYVIPKADTTVSISERNVGAGLSINPEDTLGSDLEKSVFRLDAKYRLNERHAISGTWYKVSNKGKNELKTDLEWVDDKGEEISISAGSKLETDLGYELLKLNYLWSFYHNNKVEIFTGIGLHITRFYVDLDIENTGLSGSSSETKDISSTIPLPNLGIGFVYNITPKWQWFLKTDLFAMRLDDWKGSYSDFQLGMEYQVLKNLGLGVGIGSNNLNVTEVTDDYKFTYDNRISGMNFYVSSSF